MKTAMTDGESVCLNSVNLVSKESFSIPGGDSPSLVSSRCLALEGHPRRSSLDHSLPHHPILFSHVLKFTFTNPKSQFAFFVFPLPPLMA